MAVFKLKLRSSLKNDLKPQPVVLDVRYKSTYLIYSTKQKVTPIFWDAVKEEITPNPTKANFRKVYDGEKRNFELDYLAFVKELRAINETLRAIKLKAIEVYNELEKEGIEIDNAILRERIGAKKKVITKESFKTVDQFFEMYLNGDISEAVRKSAGSGSAAIGRFHRHRKIKPHFSDLDENYYNALLKFLRDNEGYAPRTIGKAIGNLKMVAKEAKRQGYPIHEDVLGGVFKKPSSTDSMKPIYLNEEEIEKIFKHEFEKDYLDNARDWLVIGVWTGLRISDLLKLSMDDLKSGNFEVVPEKTKGRSPMPVVIPIHPQFQAILDKRGGQLPRKISDQRFNDYIKEVGKEVGFDTPTNGYKMITSGLDLTRSNKRMAKKRRVAGVYPRYELMASHICRRSFATNHYGKFSNATIMAVTGHKSEATFLHYVKITNKEHAEAIKRHWDDSYKGETRLTYKDVIAENKSLKERIKILEETIQTAMQNKEVPNLKIVQ